MAYRIEITAETFRELAQRAAILAAQLNADVNATTHIPTLQSDEEVSRAQGAKTPTAHAAATAARTASAQRVPPTPAVKVAGNGKTTEVLVYEKDVAPRILSFVQEHGREAALAILKTFGVSKAPELKAEQYPGVLAAIEAARG
jgi:nucleotide-binding universal stress UspA family protein